GKARPHPEIKASDDFRRALVDLRDALVEANDDERIDDLMDQYDELRESEQPELHDEVEVTEEAQEKAPKALRLLTAQQTAMFLGTYAEGINDPREKLRQALEQVRQLQAAKWEEYRDEVSEEVGWLVGGLDGDKSQKVSDEVVQWLIVIRSLKDDEFKKQRAELEQKVEEIVGDIGPTEVLRN